MNNIEQKTDFDKATEKHAVTSDLARKEKRELWAKVILLSSAILGFSVTMFSKDYSIAVCVSLLKISWVLFFVNVISGLILLKKETELEVQQSFARIAQEWDKTEINIPVKTQDDKDKFLALTYLHALRITPKKDWYFSKKAEEIFEKTKYSLTSWQMTKDPEKFYSYRDQREINIATNLFYGSFALAMLFIILSVIF